MPRRAIVSDAWVVPYKRRIMYGSRWYVNLRVIRQAVGLRKLCLASLQLLRSCQAHRIAAPDRMLC
jgi:hypothetical protein